MKCPNCGYENPEGATFCNFCGKTIAPAPAARPPQPSSYQPVSPPSTVERPRQCVSCGRSIPWAANVCPYCGHDYRVPIYNYPQQETLSSGMRALLYIISFLIPIAGIILGIVYYVKPDPEMKRVGRNCMIIAVLVWVIIALIYVAVFALVVSVSNIFSMLSGTISA
jgi:predicted RNA-binding Zn-ribbon protein involved in translation (DUF1610 family)